MFFLCFWVVKCAITGRRTKEEFQIPSKLNVTRHALNESDSSIGEQSNTLVSTTNNTPDVKVGSKDDEITSQQDNLNQSKQYEKSEKDVAQSSKSYNEKSNVTKSQNQKEDMIIDNDKSPYINQRELYVKYGKDIIPPSESYNITSNQNQTKSVDQKNKKDDDLIISGDKNPYYNQGELYEEYGKNIFPPGQGYNITSNKTRTDNQKQNMIIENDKSPYDNQGELYIEYGQKIFPPNKGYNITTFKNQTKVNDQSENENMIIGKDKSPYDNQGELFEKYGKDIIPPSSEYNITSIKAQQKEKKSEQKEEEEDNEFKGKSPYDNQGELYVNIGQKIIPPNQGYNITTLNTTKKNETTSHKKITVRLPRFYQDKTSQDKYAFPQNVVEFEDLPTSHREIVAKLLFKIISPEDLENYKTGTDIEKAIQIYKDIDSNIKNDDDHLDDFDEQHPESKSPLPPNTKLSDDGQLVCLEGFITNTSSVGAAGCWQCSSECHSLAKCASPGRCECPFGFAGDGILACVAPKPVVVSAEASRNGDILVFYSGVPHGFVPPEAHCLFGDRVTRASSFTNTTVTCAIPPDAPTGTVAVSFDSTQWSDPRSVSRGGVKWLNAAVYVIAIAAVAAFLLKPLAKRCKRPGVDDMAPLMLISSELPNVRFEANDAD